jgi:hypothetical protein
MISQKGETNMTRSWIVSYWPLVKVGRWKLVWTGFWSWFPERSGYKIGATRQYQDLYGERWWPLFVSLHWGPFKVTYQCGGLEASQAACNAAARLAEELT